MPPTQIIRTTCPRDCYDACGIAVAKRADGKIKVLGDPDHPVSRGALCGKCAIAYNGAWLDPKVRLTQPLKRIGAKGEATFEPVTWDEAIGAIAARLKSIVADHGAQTIWHSHYTGTCSLIAGGFPQRFLNRLGASEIEPDSICNAAGHVALQYMYGTSVEGFDPRMAKDAAAILIWGANPHASAPHQHKHWIREIAGQDHRRRSGQASDRRGGRISILQPFPGSDAALAFAIAHVMRARGQDRPRLPRRACDRLGGARARDRALHPGMGGADHRRAGGADRGSRAPVRRRPVVALDGPGPAAPAHGRQRVPRRRACSRRSKAISPSRAPDSCS